LWKSSFESYPDLQHKMKLVLYWHNFSQDFFFTKNQPLIEAFTLLLSRFLNA